MQKEVVSGNQAYDFVGMVLSILCGIHCIITPILILSFPFLDERLNSPWVHGVLIAFVALAFYQSVYLHFKIHKSKKTLVTGIVGFVILLGVSIVEIFAHADEHGHGHGGAEGYHDESFMLYFAVTGSVLLVTSHILNIKECKCLTGKGVCKED